MPDAALRHWRDTDAPTLLDAVGDHEVARQLPDIGNVVEARSFIAKTNGDDGRISYAITLDGEVVGGVAAQLNRQMRTAWISYWLVERARGLGLASRATVAMADWLFESQDIHRLELAHRLNNPDSRKVADRAGFIQEGIMREELEYEGVRYDTALMSRLVTDPRPRTEALPFA